MKYILFSILFIATTPTTYGQVNTAEDSMVSGKSSSTYIGGYGNYYYQYNSNLEKSEINLERTVLFIGHKFSEHFSFFSEIEIEDAKVEGGEEGGELAIEQAYIKFHVNRNSYINAGLFLPRIGILNENHLPNTYNGNERTIVEKYIIPSTWREIGVGFYSQLENIPANISFAVMNGLNSAGFEHGTGIRGGRYSGKEATANNLAFTGAFQYNFNNLSFQISAYAGGSVGSSPDEADSLQLESGILGTPVMLGEANVQYKNKAVSVKVLGSMFSIPDADAINAAYANNTPETAYGVYAEAAYDFLYNNKSEKKRSLMAFVRYEKLNLNASIPTNGKDDPTLDQSHVIAGLTYLPIPNIAIKADVRLMQTGEQNPDLVINPAPNASPYEETNQFINLGIGFSF
jgi:hypothetical protein